MGDYRPIQSSSENQPFGLKSKACFIVTLLLILFCIILIILIIVVIVYHSQTKHSEVGRYYKAAVATDAPYCSTVAKEILQKNGSAVDAAIASMFCVAIFNFQSCGIGGGFFMIVYDKPRSGGVPQFVTFDARETASLKASKYMFTTQNSSKFGGLSIAVPGEIKGYYEAWLKFGRLPWSDLITPSIELCRRGIKISNPLAVAIQTEERLVRSSPGLSQLFVNKDGGLRKEGEIFKLEKLATTLERISKNASDFYTGALADDVVEDIKDAGGIIDHDDLKNYQVRIREPFKAYLPNSKLSLYTMPPPSGGPIYAFMLRLLDSFNMSSDGLDGIVNLSDTYQKIVETFKFGYALKTHLGDDQFYDVKKVLENITSDDFINSIRKLITLNTTHPYSYYNPHPGDNNIQDGGTSHLSIVAPDGGIVSATATINLVLASGVVGSRTGILFNDEMDDFTIPSSSSSPSFGQGNFIEPGKRPLSSMVPSILFDDKDNLRFVIGGSGGARITSSVLYVTAHRLWLGQKIEEAVDMLRMHHQFIPDVIEHEKNFNSKVLNDLTSKGHKIKERAEDAVLSVIQVIESTCHLKLKLREDRCLVAVADFRKDGKPDGF